jgi:hypothetical protein
MRTKITQLSKGASLIISLFFYRENMQAQQVYKYNSAEKEAYRVVQQDSKSMTINYSISQLTTEDETINGRVMQSVSIPGVFLPNEAGAPDLPGNLKYIAIPQGSTATFKILSANTDTIKNIDVAPAPVIPLDKISTIGEPMVYKTNDQIYSTNAFYPENAVILTNQMQIRGIDVVSLGITPLQYNPVTKDLIVYKDLVIEINFDGGSGRFGENVYRSRWWDPILEDIIINYNQLPLVNYNERLSKALEEQSRSAADLGCEYAIIVPTNPEFSQWADSIKKFRTEQGIFTKVYKVSDIGGNTVAAIKSWVTDAYKNWTIKPAAMLILGDYGSNAENTIISTKSPGFASDNYYSDVTGDNLPDIAFSRMTARNAAELKVMCTKFLNYERNPPIDPAFYDVPVSSTGWQDDRWYQLGVEIVTGFFKSINKHPVRINSPSSPAKNTGGTTAGSGNWSTTNPNTIVSYFGDSGLKYIPNKPGSLGGFTGGSGTEIAQAISKGAFLAYHRDHGVYGGWHKPSFQSSSINMLKNVDNKLPFVFSINCNTGEYQTGSACFTENIHRYTYNGQNSGALGVIAPSEVSYSFVNDIYLWGMIDNMWPDFMPAYGSKPFNRDMRPAFASVSGQYFLQQSSWTSAGQKKITYQLFHAHIEAFQWIYSEVPKNLTIVHAPIISAGATSFKVQADIGSFISITKSTPTGPEILGTAVGTGTAVDVSLTSPADEILVTVTKQNYFRYSRIVALTTSVNTNLTSNFNFTCFPNPFNRSTTFSYLLNEVSKVNLTIYNMLGEKVAVVVDNDIQSSGKQEIQFKNNNLPAGIYTCVLKTNNAVNTKYIVIN